MIDKNCNKHAIIRFWLRMLCFFLVFIAGIAFCWILFEPFWLDVVKDKIIFDTNNLTNQDVKYLHELISANKMHTAEFAFDRLIQFYEHVITIIISFTAGLGIIGYCYIKSSHQRDIEEGIYSFCSSTHGKNILKEYIKEMAQDYFKESFNRALNEDVLKGIIIANAQNSEDVDNILKRLTLLEESIIEKGIQDTGKINIPEEIDYSQKGNINDKLETKKKSSRKKKGQ